MPCVGSVERPAPWSRPSNCSNQIGNALHRIRLSLALMGDTAQHLRGQVCAGDAPVGCRVELDVQGVDSGGGQTGAVQAKLRLLMDGPRGSGSAPLEAVTCSTPALVLERGAEVQMFKIPRAGVVSEDRPGARLGSASAGVTVGADFEATVVAADGSVTPLAAGESTDLRCPDTVALAVKHVPSQASILFPLSEDACDEPLLDLGRLNGTASAVRDFSQGASLLGCSISELLRCNFGAAWGMAQSSGIDDKRKRGMSCADFESTLARLQTGLGTLDALRRDLLPAAVHAHTLSLFDVAGTMTKSEFRVASLGQADGAHVLSTVAALRRAAADVEAAWASLASGALPGRDEVLAFYAARAPSGVDVAGTLQQIEALLQKREQQERHIAELRPASRPSTECMRAGQAQVWSGRAYAAMADVRAHYVGLSAVDAALQRLCLRIDGAPAGTGWLLPLDAHLYQLRQLLTKNEANDILLSGAAFEHNAALVRHTIDAVADGSAFEPAWHDPARQVRGAGMLRAVLARQGFGQQSLLGTSATIVQTRRTAARLPRPPFLERVSPGDGEQHLALCQLHALVNSDHLNRIVAPALYRSIVGALESAAHMLVTDPVGFRARRKSEPWRTQASRITRLFAEPLRPLVGTALGVLPGSGGALDFLGDASVGTGYDGNACLETLVENLLTHPGAGRSLCPR